jgi:monofunctional biosynthetic peptidoglycan transglycosylase
MTRRAPSPPPDADAAPVARRGFFVAVGRGALWLARLPWRLLRLLRRAALVALLAALFAVALYRVVDPPITPYMVTEVHRLGGVQQDWVPLERIAPVMARAAVAAEDARFCRHWGLDIRAIRAAIEDGGRRGGSTISQQVVKNVYLWHGRSWPRKALEAALTPVVEAAWPKRRILEVYLNVAEFGEGVFGVGAAARHHFDTTAAGLSPAQAAALAAILPAPKLRDPAAPSARLRRRAAAIRDGAATLARDGRDGCFVANADG